MESLGNQTMDWNYLDFELEIGAGSGRRYPVTVIQSVAGEAREVMHFPFDDLVLENQLLILQNVLLRSGGSRRRVPLSEEQAVQRFGQALFEALFIGEVRSRYAVSQQEAFSQGKGLRLKLRIQSSALAALPWEFLYDPGQGEYVCLSSNTPIVRYLELPRPPQPLTVTPPLRILGMIASPENLGDLDVEREQQRVERATERVRASGNVTLTWLEGQTWQDLQRAMRRGPWHVFHFIGHGGYDSNVDEGLIALTDEDGQAHYLSSTQLGLLLTDHHPLRLVVLNACEGARGGKRDIFSSTAATLVRRGVPAVLAMQYDITDQAAIELSRAFYEAIADGLPVDTAVGEARKAISLGIVNTLEWGTPVLYMRAPDGVLFSVVSQSVASREPLSAPATERATSSSRERAVEEGLSASTSSEETERISSVPSSPTNVQVPPPVQPLHPPSRVALGEPGSVAPSEGQAARTNAADTASTDAKQTSWPEAFPGADISPVAEKQLEEQARKAEEERVRKAWEEGRAGQAKEQADKIEEAGVAPALEQASQVKQLEAEPEPVPVAPASETTDTSQSQQSTGMAIPVPLQQDGTEPTVPVSMPDAELPSVEDPSVPSARPEAPGDREPTVPTSNASESASTVLATNAPSLPTEEADTDQDEERGVQEAEKDSVHVSVSPQAPTEAPTVLPARPGERYLTAVIIGVFLSLVSIVFTNVIPILTGTDPYPSYLQVLPPLVLSLIPGLLLRKSGVARKASLLTGLVVGVSWFVFILAKYANAGILPQFPPEAWFATVACAAACGPLSWLVVWLTTHPDQYGLSSSNRNEER